MEVENLLQYARLVDDIPCELPRLLARVCPVSSIVLHLDAGPQAQMLLPRVLYEACLALSEPLSIVCAKADGDDIGPDQFEQAAQALLNLRHRGTGISRELAATFDAPNDPAPASRLAPPRKMCILFGLLFGWPAFLAYLNTEPDSFWQPHVAKTITVLVLLVPTVDSVMQTIPDSPPEWITGEAPAPLLSTVQASACVPALRDCIILLAGYPRSLPAAELALHHLVQIGLYAASGSEGPRDPVLSRIVSIALTTIVQEWQLLGRRSRNLIASLLARVNDGYGARPAVQAWAEAHRLGDTLRVAVFLAPED